MKDYVKNTSKSIWQIQPKLVIFSPQINMIVISSGGFKQVACEAVYNYCDSQYTTSTNFSSICAKTIHFSVEASTWTVGIRALTHIGILLLLKWSCMIIKQNTGLTPRQCLSSVLNNFKASRWSELMRKTMNESWSSTWSNCWWSYKLIKS